MRNLYAASTATQSMTAIRGKPGHRCGSCHGETEEVGILRRGRRVTRMRYATVLSSPFLRVTSPHLPCQVGANVHVCWSGRLAVHVLDVHSVTCRGGGVAGESYTTQREGENNECSHH